METIHIALSFDDDYAESCIVLMTSLLLNKGDEKLHFHILDFGISSDLKRQIFDLSNCEISFHLINNKILDYCNKAGFPRVCSLGSLILPEVIRVDKIIYLDSDMVARTSLKELWQMDFDDNYVIAVEDINCKKLTKKFGLSDGSKIFNQGLMLVNCKKWLDDEISKSAINLSKNDPNLKAKGLLNKLFESKVKFADFKWNFQYSSRTNNLTPETKNEYEIASLQPCIIHYSGDFKPWKKGLGCFNPRQNDFLKYHKLTCYAHEDYKQWKSHDKMLSIKGFFAIIKNLLGIVN